MRFVYQDFTKGGLIVGIYGENAEELKYRFYSFWNHGATDGEAIWLSENFLYFWTDKKRLENSLKRKYKHVNPALSRGEVNKLVKIELAGYEAEKVLMFDKEYTAPYEIVFNSSGAEDFNSD